MKRERVSILVLVAEIAAIIYLHSIKTRPSTMEGKVAHDNHQVNATYQLKALPVTRLK